MSAWLKSLCGIVKKAISPRPLRGLRLELRNLERAIAKTQRKIDDLYNNAVDNGTCPCCISASYGGYMGIYTQLIEKNIRRKDRLKQIVRILYENDSR